jgi:hypothetical protein
VEHPCHRCGAAVEDGILFCKNCGAPQIRVTAQAAPESVTSDFELGPVQGTAYTPPGFRTLHTKIDWPSALRVALVCGLLEALFSLFGLGIIAGGALTVALYRRRQSHVAITVGMGARLGAVSGGVAWVVLTAITAVGTLVFRTGDRLRQMIFDSMEKAAARNPTAEAEQLLQYVKSPEGFPIVLALILLMSLVIFVILSTLGGMLGSALLNKRNH